MSDQYVEVDLTAEEKKLIIDLASFFIMDKITEADLKNPRKKWIKFKARSISEITGELAYHFNRCKSGYKSAMLDQLIDHLEFYEKNGSQH